jgi:DNA invertase Pin-like site-specific DNA recombinase
MNRIWGVSSNMRPMPKKTPLSKHKTVGYLRVSTGEQEREKYKADILQLANQEALGRVRFVKEKVSGKIAWRKRCIADLLDSLQATDSFVVSELSRLGRSMLEFMEILSVAAQKGVNVYAVKDDWRLDQSIQSMSIAMAFSMAAEEIERDLISQRSTEALRFCKAQGLKLGRPQGPGKSKLDLYGPESESRLANGATQGFVVRRYHTTETNLHN